MPPDSDFPLDPPERGDYSLPRDINNVGQVVGYYADSNKLSHGFLATPFPDYNANGTVDAADYTVWKTHFGETAGSGSNATGYARANAAVSEPSSLALVFLGIAGLSIICRMAELIGRGILS